MSACVFLVGAAGRLMHANAAGRTLLGEAKVLYGNTGTARQADLVKLVAGFASPLLN